MVTIENTLDKQKVRERGDRIFENLSQRLASIAITDNSRNITL